jgi:hypothetical protein
MLGPMVAKIGEEFRLIPSLALSMPHFADTGRPEYRQLSSSVSNFVTSRQCNQAVQKFVPGEQFENPIADRCSVPALSYRTLAVV